MITKDEIMQIINNRETRLEEWLKNNPEKLSLKKIKLELGKWTMEIFEAHKLSEESDPLFPKDDLRTVYTFMNIMTTIRANYVIALVYIKKLEDKISKLKK